MICPHCKYEHEWNGTEALEDDNGEFYKLIVPLQRETWYENEQRSLYACPSCGKTFIEV